MATENFLLSVTGFLDYRVDNKNIDVCSNYLQQKFELSINISQESNAMLTA